MWGEKYLDQDIERQSSACRQFEGMIDADGESAGCTDGLHAVRASEAELTCRQQHYLFSRRQVYMENRIKRSAAS